MPTSTSEDSATPKRSPFLAESWQPQLGCVAVLAAVGGLVLWLGPFVFFLVFVAVILVLVLIHWAWRAHRARVALDAFREKWQAQGKDLLLVYSNSPHWKEYIEEHWIPRWGHRAVVLNWSERSTWDPKHPGPEVALFREFTTSFEYNPVAIVVGPMGREATTVEFWKAFREFKHDKPARLRAAEERLAACLEALDQGRDVDSVPEAEDPDERRRALREGARKRGQP